MAITEFYIGNFGPYYVDESETSFTSEDQVIRRKELLDVLYLPVVLITFADSPYTYDPTIVGLLGVDATGGTVVVVLSPVIDSTLYRYKIVKLDASTNAVSISGNANISGETNIQLADQYTAIVIESTGVEFVIF